MNLITGKSRHFTCFGVLHPDTLLALLGSDLIFLRCYAELILLFGWWKTWTSIGIGIKTMLVSVALRNDFCGKMSRLQWTELKQYCRKVLQDLKNSLKRNEWRHCIYYSLYSRLIFLATFFFLHLSMLSSGEDSQEWALCSLEFKKNDKNSRSS